jgi:hypothetical protein
MEYTTDFVGHIDIDPALNQDEIEYLTAFAASRRFDRPEGPYAVPGNPYADERYGGRSRVTSKVLRRAGLRDEATRREIDGRPSRLACSPDIMRRKESSTWRRTG